MNEQTKLNINSEYIKNTQIEESEKNKIKNKLEKLFNDTPELQERFMKNINVFIRNGVLRETATSELTEYLKIKNKDNFINKALILFDPLLKMKISNPELFEKIFRDAFLEQGNFIKLNEILSYGVSGSSVHIHLAPLKELLRRSGKEKILSLIVDGLKKLAEVFKENKDFKKVTATSPVVANNMEYLTNFGFSIKELMNEKDKEKYWKGEIKNVGQAEMSRDSLLKYLNE